jgi:MprA protease rhombosortase-interaction domain-containing protein
MVPVLWDHFAVLAASLLLVAGAWGFQRRRRWGRPFLIAHAVLTIVTVASMHVVSLIQYLPVLNGLPTKLATLTGEINLAMCECLFAIFLLLCLRRPELRDAFSHSGRGFAPLFAPEQPMPATPVAPVAESRSFE